MSNQSSILTDGVGEIVTDLRLFQTIADEMERWLGSDSSGHDMAHVWRVFDVGVRLAAIENANYDVVGAAALTHDVHRSMGEDSEYVHPEDSLPEVRTILETTEFPAEHIRDVLHCIEVHDEYDFRGIERPAETIEAEILRDADNLDAIGAVGIARNFAFTGVVGNPLWDPEGQDYSGLGHFHDKLFYLKDEINTDAAQSIAERRHEFLKLFFEQFKKEWGGKL